MGGEIQTKDVRRSAITRTCDNGAAEDGERLELATYASLRPSRHGKDIYNSSIGARVVWTRVIPLKSARAERIRRTWYLCDPRKSQEFCTTGFDQCAGLERVQREISMSTVCVAGTRWRKWLTLDRFKIIILDEADNLTQDAQSALRRTMEIHSKITRFCLCANYASRIIDPVASRCSKFRFQMLQGEDAVARVKEILTAEGVGYEDGVIEKVLSVADGDLRRAINLLQSAARLVGAGQVSNGANGNTARKKGTILDDDEDEDEEMPDIVDNLCSKKITVPIIDEIAGVIPTPIIEALFKEMRKGSATNYKQLSLQISEIVASGYSANEVLSSLFSRIIWDEDVASRKKNELTGIFSSVDKQLLDGSDEELTMLDMVLQCSTILARK